MGKSVKDPRAALFRAVFGTELSTPRDDLIATNILGNLSYLPEDVACVLSFRHGLEDGNQYSYEDIGPWLGITAKAAQQRHREGIQSLRQPKYWKSAEEREADWADSLDRLLEYRPDLKRGIDALARHGITRISHLRRTRPRDVLAVPGFSKASYSALMDALWCREVAESPD